MAVIAVSNIASEKSILKPANSQVVLGAGCVVSKTAEVATPVDASAGCVVQKNEPVEQPIDASAGCTVM